MQKNSAVTAQGSDQIDGGAHQTSPAELYPPANDMDNSKIAAEANQSGQDWSNNQAAPSQRPAGYPVVLTHPNQHGHQAPFDMGPLNDLLPTTNHRQRQQSIHYVNSPPPSYVPTSPNAGPYMQHMPSFSNQSVQMTNQPFYVQQPHLPQYYLPAQMHQTPRQSFVQTQQSMVYYPNQVVANHAQQGFFYSQDGQFAGHSSGAPPNVLTNAYLAGSSKAGQRTHQSGISRQVRGQRALQDTSPAKQNAVRGPPRKPRQSGHALWIGNLPPQADLMALVQHICKITPGLESLFLISKSNCAFANYKDEASCSAAQQLLHDSKFQSVRLVSRLRKSAVEGTTGTIVPTGPAAGANIAGTQPENPDTTSRQDDPELDLVDPVQNRQLSPAMNRDIHSLPQTDKFFILKSLTVEDLELSVRNGIWATQSHNEENLNNAFRTAESVYLIFSANKSGEYFGYARMTSEIDNDPAAAIEFAPKALAAAEIDVPKAIPTEATEFAPRGRIIDDSARGTIFWEAERDDDDDSSDSGSEVTSEKIMKGDDETKVWGKPFKLEWLSTLRLPFFRTRGLRNPWNSNREVKIARDGTEIEPSVGRKLIGLFNRAQTSPMNAPPAGTSMNFTPTYTTGQHFDQ